MENLQGLKRVRTNVKDRENLAESEEEPMSPWARVFHEADSNLFVIAILGFKTKLQPSFVKENLVHSLLKNPRFSCLQVVDEKTKMMKWVKTCINVEEHVIVPDLNLDMKMDSAHTFIEDYISNLSKTTMDKTRPLWELHILNLTTCEAESVAIFKVHHSLGDGFTLLSLLLASTRKVSDPEALPTFPMKKKTEETNQRGFSWSKFWWLLGLVWNTIVDVIMLIATLMFLKDTKTPFTNSISGSYERRFVFKIVSLDDIKFIKNATNSTVNDVILGVIEAGLSRHLNRIYGCSKITSGAIETEKENNLPQKLFIRTLIPINLRPSTVIQGMLEEQNAKGMSANDIGYVLLPLTVAIKDDPLDYIRSAKAAMDRKKYSLEATATSTIFKFLLKVFGIKGARFWAHRIPSQITMAFSNLPGPMEEIAYHGHPISYLAPTSYGLPNALVIHVQSYFNKVAIVLSVDESTIPNPRQLCTDLLESLNLIKDATLATASTIN